MSPDGTKIAYMNGNSVYVVEVATGESSKVTEGTWPAWLDDDTLVVTPSENARTRIPNGRLTRSSPYGGHGRSSGTVDRLDSACSARGFLALGVPMQRSRTGRPRYQGTPAADARNIISGEIRSQSFMNVAMKVVEVTCLSVSRTDPVKLLRLMSSIIG
jgi:hypothetical protein